MLLYLDDDELVMCDARTGERLLAEAEAAEAKASAASAQASAEAAKANAEAAKAKAAEQEAARLRRKLREHGLSE